MHTHSSGNYICSYDGCLENHYALGLCRSHWQKANIKAKQDNSMWTELTEEDVKSILNKAFTYLTERERQIISLRFDNQLAFKQIGKKFGVTLERVRQIEVKAIKKLRTRIMLARRKEEK